MRGYLPILARPPESALQPRHDHSLVKLPPPRKTAALTPRRAKRFAPKTKTGCLVCRSRRVKCDEGRPSCRRCIVGKWECHYAPPTPPRDRTSPPVLLLQPPTYLCPDGVHPESYEIDLFGTFRSSMVTVIGGAFNHEFWKIDIPTAAQIYPCIWHATVALTAIYKSIKVDKKSVRRVLGSTTTPARNQLYCYALVHFNKSIRSLTSHMSSYASDLTQLEYRDKQVLIMTTVLYIGLCGMLSDDGQIRSQCESLTQLLEGMRFGEEDVRTRNGIMSHNDLLSVILTIDSSMYEQMELPPRWGRQWVVTCPQVDTITSMTDAYLAMLPTQFMSLLKREVVMAPAYQGAVKNRFRLDMLESFVTKLNAYRYSQKAIPAHELEALRALDLFMELSFIREDIILAKTRDEAIAANERLLCALDKVDYAMGQQSSLDAPFSSEPPPFAFAPSFGRLLYILLSVSNSPQVRRRGIELMKKWPYSEIGVRSDELVAMIEIWQHHAITGPDRTRPWQQSGLPILSHFQSSDASEPAFDPYSECECIPDVFICRDHKMGSYKKDVYGSTPRYGVMSWYEQRHDLPYSWYPFPY